jgi:peroxiredoxin Q/BCP
MLKVGDSAPDFRFTDLHGQQRKLTDLRGRKATIVYFYPRDFTPGCTREACSFRDRYPDIQDKDAEVIGISPQDESMHDAFRQRHHLPFPLVADTDRAIAKAYGVVGVFGRIKRATFAVDKAGIIRQVVHAEVLVDKHADAVDAILRDLGD